jgi:hypothetical protein
LVEVDQLSHNLKAKLIEEKKAEIKECRDKVDILKEVGKFIIRSIIIK